ncbi:hypothetical protein FHS92_003500 [Sphingobium subterraneum]|jgi:hypothetical protein|uniref:Uncharacterized protein n=2 Tax=Sphingomonadaceae TaxID=41297 RepID=A0A841J855_9SPHN|nr:MULTISPECIES: hypothetical protein [Sphingomonadaceae]MBB6125736.1 hypothetical protein [Sphingobium subterraneum]OAN54223.1 hypothetical protein A7Q26_24240 [Sphingobium sp. TCM1]BBF72380.1 hypothetical protein SBA_pBAR2_120 [Sphingomonas bisphenolicum]|tara:strand:- start:6645 stop:6908 length:264 start_codon:yes stop_codon:yes gene_type:complete
MEGRERLAIQIPHISYVTTGREVRTGAGQQDRSYIAVCERLLEFLVEAASGFIIERVEAFRPVQGNSANALGRAVGDDFHVRAPSFG